MKIRLPSSTPVQFDCCGTVFNDVTNETFMLCPSTGSGFVHVPGPLVVAVFSVGWFQLSGSLVESGDVLFSIEDVGCVVKVQVLLGPRFVDQNFSCIKTTPNTQTSI